MSSTNPNRPRREKIADHPGLYRLPNGKVQARFRDETGKVVDRTYPTLTAAVRAKGKVAAGDRRPDARIPFKTYALEWVETYTGRKTGTITDDTRDAYRFSIKTYAVPFFGTMRLERLDPPALKRFIKHLEQKGLAPASIRRYFLPIRAMLATAYEDGILARPVNIRIVLDERQQRPPKPRLTAADTAALLAEIPPDHADLALMYATTGARLSEPLALRYRDLGRDDEGHPTVRFPRSKTEAGLKPIRLTPDMAQALTRRRAAAGAGPDDLVFPSMAGGELDARNWRKRVFKPAAKRAGVPWATPHQLRHGVATLMAATGATSYDIARMLRHADGGRLAQRTYIHGDAPDVAFLDTALRAARQPNNPTPNPTTQQTDDDLRQAN
jgi:integrase